MKNSRKLGSFRKGSLLSSSRRLAMNLSNTPLNSPGTVSPSGNSIDSWEAQWQEEEGFMPGIDKPLVESVSKSHFQLHFPRWRFFFGRVLKSRIILLVLCLGALFLLVLLLPFSQLLKSVSRSRIAEQSSLLQPRREQGTTEGKVGESGIGRNSFSRGGHLGEAKASGNGEWKLPGSFVVTEQDRAGSVSPKDEVIGGIGDRKGAEQLRQPTGREAEEVLEVAGATNIEAQVKLNTDPLHMLTNESRGIGSRESGSEMQVKVKPAMAGGVVSSPGREEVQRGEVVGTDVSNVSANTSDLLVPGINGVTFPGRQMTNHSFAIATVLNESMSALHRNTTEVNSDSKVDDGRGMVAVGGMNVSEEHGTMDSDEHASMREDKRMVQPSPEASKGSMTAPVQLESNSALSEEKEEKEEGRSVEDNHFLPHSNPSKEKTADRKTDDVGLHRNGNPMGIAGGSNVNSSAEDWLMVKAVAMDDLATVTDEGSEGGETTETEGAMHIGAQETLHETLDESTSENSSMDSHKDDEELESNAEEKRLTFLANLSTTLVFTSPEGHATSGTADSLSHNASQTTVVAVIPNNNTDLAIGLNRVSTNKSIVLNNSLYLDTPNNRPSALSEKVTQSNDNSTNVGIVPIVTQGTKILAKKKLRGLARGNNE